MPPQASVAETGAWVPAAWSRRKPYPWSVRLNEVGLMIPGELVGRKIQSMAPPCPTPRSTARTTSTLRRSAPFRGPLLGMGDGSQRSHDLNRYLSGHNTWISGLWRGKGARFRWQTPPVSDGGRSWGCSPRGTAPPTRASPSRGAMCCAGWTTARAAWSSRGTPAAPPSSTRARSASCTPGRAPRTTSTWPGGRGPRTPWGSCGATTGPPGPWRPSRPGS